MADTNAGKVKEALRSPTVQSRCVDLTLVFSHLPVEDLHRHFPHLLSNIFGFDGSSGWYLKMLTRETNKDDFESVLRFLQPGGTIFQLIAKLQANQTMHYEFPLTCLPVPTQEALLSGSTPPLYAGKVSQENGSVGLALTAYEYYMFHFAYFVVYWSQRGIDWAPKMAQTLYVVLLDEYLNHWLPPSGPIIAGHSWTSSSPAGAQAQLTSPLLSRTGLTAGSRFPQTQSTSTLGQSVPKALGLLRSVGGSNSSSSPSGQESRKSGFQGSANLWETEIFLQVLVEFWLNQFTTSTPSTAFNQLSALVCLVGEDHLRLVRMLIKHLHMFSVEAGRSNMVHSTNLSPQRHQTLSAVTNELRRTVISQYTQRKLFVFLSYHFAHWPLDPSFRVVLETWLSYIQPWRYTSLVQEESLDQQRSYVSSRWKSFVSGNVLFYTRLLLDFFVRIFRLDLRQPGNCILLLRIAKVFSQPHLMHDIAEAERVFISQLPQSSSFSSSPGFEAGLSRLQAFAEKEAGDASSYSALCQQSTYNMILQLLDQLVSVHAGILNSNGINPVLNSPRLSWWKWLEKVFLEDVPSAFEAVGSDTVTADPKKVAQQLELTITHLATAFEVPAPPLQTTAPSPQSKGETRTSGFSTSFAPRPSHLSPHYLPGFEGRQLSDIGRRQVMAGECCCDNQSVAFPFDPDRQPIRSYENVFLVRFLHRLAQRLNRSYVPAVQGLLSRGDYMSKSVHALLSISPNAARRKDTRLYATPPSTPSQPSWYKGDPVTLGASPTLSAPEGLRGVTPQLAPHLSLRWLASYRTLFQLGIFLVILFVIQPSALSWFFLSILFVFVALVISQESRGFYQQTFT